MMRSWAYNCFGVLMGTSWQASCPRRPSLREDSWPMITLFPSQGDFCATARFLFVDSPAEFENEDSGIDQLRVILREQIARNARRNLLVSRALESYIGLVSDLRVEVVPKEAAARELLDTAQFASRKLGRTWR